MHSSNLNFSATGQIKCDQITQLNGYVLGKWNLYASRRWRVCVCVRVCLVAFIWFHFMTVRADMQPHVYALRWCALCVVILLAHFVRSTCARDVINHENEENVKLLNLSLHIDALRCGSVFFVLFENNNSTWMPNSHFMLPRNSYSFFRHPSAAAARAQSETINRRIALKITRTTVTNKSVPH